MIKTYNYSVEATILRELPTNHRIDIGRHKFYVRATDDENAKLMVAIQFDMRPSPQYFKFGKIIRHSIADDI